jgi:hypothetical protein
MEARYIVGSCVDELLAMPPGSVDLAITSPPFLGLRDYLDADDPMKPFEHGAVGTPVEFVDQMLDMVEAVGHVLAPHGSLVIELGDSMSGSGGAGGDYYNADGLRAGQPKPPGSAKLAGMVKGRSRAGDPVPRNRPRDTRPGREGTPSSSPPRHEQMGGAGWPLPKSLALIPEMLRLTLAYGVQPYTGRTVEPWRVRNVVRWCKPNPSVGDEGDKFRRGTNDVLIATRATNRWWDPLAARGPSRTEPGKTSPLLDWWEIPTGGYPGAHHATFPLAFVRPFIETMCPLHVCTTCGEPRRRVVKRTEDYENARGGGDLYGGADGNDRGIGRNGGQDGTKKRGLVSADYEHDYWTDCGHHTWRRGVVLDPYAGTGTTLAVANGCGRDGLGIDADHRNVPLAVERVGPLFITVQEGTAHAAATSAHDHAL